MSGLASHERLAALASLRATGTAHLRAVTLADGWSPEVADVILLRVDGRYEAHLPPDVEFEGDGHPRHAGAESRNGDSRVVLLESDAEALMSAVSATLLRGGGESRSRDLVESLTDLSLVTTPRVEPNLSAAYPTAEELFAELRQVIRGQDTALWEISVCCSTHLRTPSPLKPNALYLVGPSGVGKTQACLELGRIVDERSPSAARSYLRIDCAELADHGSSRLLFGAPPSFVGYDDGGRLVEHLEACPNGVVLLDEIDKAHPSILRSLMSCLDAGRVTSTRPINGKREIECNAATFVFTSNEAAHQILEAVEELSDPTGYAIDQVARQCLLRSGLADHLVGRVTAVIPFVSLSPEATGAIAVLAIKRCVESFDLELEFVQPELVLHVMSQSDVGTLGARTIEYAASRLLSGCLSEANLAGAKAVRLEFSDRPRAIITRSS